MAENYFQKFESTVIINKNVIFFFGQTAFIYYGKYHTQQKVQILFITTRWCPMPGILSQFFQIAIILIGSDLSSEMMFSAFESFDRSAQQCATELINTQVIHTLLSGVESHTNGKGKTIQMQMRFLRMLYVYFKSQFYKGTLVRSNLYRIENEMKSQCFTFHYHFSFALDSRVWNSK